jgi:hypothetical protein
MSSADNAIFVPSGLGMSAVKIAYRVGESTAPALILCSAATVLGQPWAVRVLSPAHSVVAIGPHLSVNMHLLPKTVTLS